MNRASKTLTAIVTVVIVLAAACRQHTLGPDEVDDSLPRPTSANEPTGFTPVANRGFNKLDEDNWIWGGIQSAYQGMQDASAPQSQPAISRITVPAGFPAGGSPIHLERNIRSNDHLYLNFWFRISDTWKNNSIFDALVAVWAGNQPRIFIGWRTDGQGQGMYPAASVTAPTVQGGTRWLNANLVPDIQVAKGGWHHFEVEIQSRPGATGRYVCWLDGVKIASYEDVPFNVLEENRHWSMLQVGAAWGGLTEPLNITQTLDFDHVYASAAP